MKWHQKKEEQNEHEQAAGMVFSFEATISYRGNFPLHIRGSFGVACHRSSELDCPGVGNFGCGAYHARYLLFRRIF